MLMPVFPRGDAAHQESSSWIPQAGRTHNTPPLMVYGSPFSAVGNIIGITNFLGSLLSTLGCLEKLEREALIEKYIVLCDSIFVLNPTACPVSQVIFNNNKTKNECYCYSCSAGSIKQEPHGYPCCIFLNNKYILSP